MTQLVAFLVRAAFVLVVARVLARFLAGVVRGYRGAGPEPARKRTAELVRDRVCNTFVPRERSLAATIDGREERFCSAGCRDKALVAARRAS